MLGGLGRPGRPVALALVVALAVAAVLAGVAVLKPGTPAGRPAGSAREALGSRRFDHQRARCRVQPAETTRAAPASTRLLLGLEASVGLFTGPSRCEELQLAQQTGVHALREDLLWADAEPRPGHYSWGVEDSLVRAVTDSGLTLLPVLDAPPRWAAAASTGLPSDPAAFAAFTAAVVRRYGPGGTFWHAHPRLPVRPLVSYELWNEPWQATANRDPGLYARLVRAAVVAGRAVSPKARFLVDAETTYVKLDGQMADWLAGMYAAVGHLGRYFDALSVHPYGGDPGVYIKGDSLSPPVLVDTVRRELIAHGDGDRPLWVTEVGWSTCTGNQYCVSSARQAAYLREFLKLARTSWRSFVRAVFVYDLRDSGAHPRTDVPAWYGLLAPDLFRKPAWYVLRAAASQAG